MKRRKRIAGTVFLLLALFCTGCGRRQTSAEFFPFAFAKAAFSESYTVADNRKADFLQGRAAEVCIPSVMTDDNDLTNPYGAYGLYNVSENKVLEEYCIQETLYPASTTKLMTALLTLKKCNLDEPVTISYNASHLGVEGATLFGFSEGDKTTVRDLLSALLVFSGNDAAIALAEHVAGSVEGFAELMNEEAKRLGAVDTHFVNPHGLDNMEHYTTAYDIYLIFNELLSYPEFLSTISMSSCTIIYMDAEGNQKETTWYNTNHFQNKTYPLPDGIELIGGKTGTTPLAGFCNIIYFKDRNGTPYIAEVFRASSYDNLYGKLTELMESVIIQTDK